MPRLDWPSEVSVSSLCGACPCPKHVPVSSPLGRPPGEPCVRSDAYGVTASVQVVTEATWENSM
ncbi:hypothetical protein E2C01_060063 [Portunus trituberculatus]|uniref:Uncharacterized protein n=1 Tax=Portunus trituberculatus TaxID=210409 RepID=A0A5B7H7Q1_PORTR|nr:hypothetical protein [Portunus trituberculatus]